MRKILLILLCTVLLTSCANAKTCEETCKDDYGWKLTWFGPDGIHVFDKVCGVNFENMQYDILTFCKDGRRMYLKGGSWSLE